MWACLVGIAFKKSEAVRQAVERDLISASLFEECSAQLVREKGHSPHIWDAFFVFACSGYVGESGSGWLELRQASGGSPMTAADARPLGEPGSLRRCSSALSAQFCIE